MVDCYVGACPFALPGAALGGRYGGYAGIISQDTTGGEGIAYSAQELVEVRSDGMPRAGARFSRAVGHDKHHFEVDWLVEGWCSLPCDRCAGGD